MTSVRLPSVRPIDPVPGPPPRGFGEPSGEYVTDDRLHDILARALGVDALHRELRGSVVESGDEAALLTAWRALDADRQAEALRLLTAVQPTGEQVRTLYYVCSSPDEAYLLVTEQASEPTFFMRNRAHGRDDDQIGVDLVEDPAQIAKMPFIVAMSLRIDPLALESYRLTGDGPTAYRIPFNTVSRCRVSCFAVLPSDLVTRDLLRAAAE